MRIPRTAAAATVLVALLIHTTAHAAAPAAVPGDTVTLPVQAALAQLEVLNEDRTGYERTKL
ncbi:hypothetical protein [Streptomyces echinatus]|uniref:Uncharacterized protein n=1 Tax=Streptomyces echinatus TaxID=67293 RepID=A0A7W9PRH2_9ACTN|nr:hypothetical protein [Streptomyces echinatus]MBB5926436.1 hypothetical protein [Streptomyces echinatus]